MSLRNYTDSGNSSNDKGTKETRVTLNMEDRSSDYHIGVSSGNQTLNQKYQKNGECKSVPDQAADKGQSSTSQSLINGFHHTNGKVHNGTDLDIHKDLHCNGDFPSESSSDLSPELNTDSVHKHYHVATSTASNINTDRFTTTIQTSSINSNGTQKPSNGVSCKSCVPHLEKPKTESSHSQHRPSLELTIPVYYAHKYIFVTGATGFIGKVFLEKMLRSCPDIGGIYCLIRPKEKQTGTQRLVELLDSQMFDNLRKEQPHFCSKLHAVDGDVLLPNLGLSSEACKTLEERVNVVFHSAATVRFDEPLRKAVEMNVMSVRKMLTLCRRFQHLEAFVHVSTAYANCDMSYIEEKVYPPPVEPQKIIDVLGWMDDAMLELFTPKLIGEKPNTYTYTKQLAEHLLVTEGAGLPIAIVRPSIVGAAWKEPFPGWVDNYNGPSGIYIAAGKGILRWMKADQNALADIVPVDITVNMMIAVGWYTAVAKPKSVIIYHSTTGNATPFKWGEMEPIVNKIFKQIPLEKCFRRPKVAIVNNNLAQDYWKFVSHLFPAFICDVACALMGKKPKMIKLYNKLHRSIDYLQFFTCNEWRWETSNHEMLRNQLLPEDRETFYIDLRPIHWPTYIENYCLGAKKYLLNEDLSRLPAARAHIRKLRIIRALFNSAVCVILWRVLIAKSQFARNLWFFIVNLVSKFVQFFRITSTMHK